MPPTAKPQPPRAPHLQLLLAQRRRRRARQRWFHCSRCRVWSIAERLTATNEVLDDRTACSRPSRPRRPSRLMPATPGRRAAVGFRSTPANGSSARSWSGSSLMEWQVEAHEGDMIGLVLYASGRRTLSRSFKQPAPAAPYGAALASVRTASSWSTALSVLGPHPSGLRGGCRSSTSTWSEASSSMRRRRATRLRLTECDSRLSTTRRSIRPRKPPGGCTRRCCATPLGWAVYASSSPSASRRTEQLLLRRPRARRRGRAGGADLLPVLWRSLGADVVRGRRAAPSPAARC